MKLMKTKRAMAGSLCALVLGASPLLAQNNIGQWDFNNSNLVQTVGANLGDMTYIDGPTGSTSNLTVFGSTAALGIPSINGTNAQVMEFPPGYFPMGYYMPTPPPNGGGALVNDYTIIFDVIYTNGNTFRPLIQMDNGALDNIVAFIGIGANGQIQITNTSGAGLPSGFFGAIASQTWYRLGFTVDTDNGLITAYTNGTPVGVVNFGKQIDSPYALLASDVLPVFSSVFTNANGFVNSLMIRDEVLNPGELDALGGPSAVGIPIN